MAETLLARLTNHETQYEWTNLSTIDIVQRGNLHDLATAASNTSVILLLPATDVLLFTVELPVAHRQIAKALPYAIEDWLANEVETYHLVWNKLPDGLVAVAAIAHERLQNLLQPCYDADIKLEAVYAETLLLPYQDGEISVLLTGELATVRFGQWQGGGSDRDFLPLFIEKSIDKDFINKQLPPKLKIWSGQPFTSPWPDGVQTTIERIDEPLLMLAENLPNKPVLNLLTEHYRASNAHNFHWQHWLPAAALLLIAIGLQYGIVLNKYWQSEAELQTLETADKDLFKQTFPNLKRIVNIKTQAEQELIALRKQNHNGGSVFLRLFYQAGELLTQNPSLQLQAVEFANNTLNLQLTASDVAQLDQFKQSLQNTYGLGVKMLSAEPNETGVSARIEISGGKP
ncbi:MAG: type II secretion system protein GspL [Methylovulum sp.]|uniref:type II secretion system protein GspL n=1 Tax=Methylovulum sp. TaxID=1916980 RepID=UPI002614F374|nr:type II secretion system protein GspL [Methylovulum sp.]MDD2722727.1 type II secretion system protein GspL [Methylovulum sp.]MDD5123975.1 type II secretion system protein GspL [Methylovulum sp.]